MLTVLKTTFKNILQQAWQTFSSSSQFPEGTKNSTFIYSTNTCIHIIKNNKTSVPNYAYISETCLEKAYCNKRLIAKKHKTNFLLLL